MAGGKSEVKTMLHIAICDDDLILSKALYQFIFETYRDIDLFIDQYDSGEKFLNKICRLGCGPLFSMFAR